MRTILPDHERHRYPDHRYNGPDFPGTAKNGGCPEFSQLHILDNKGRTVTIIKEAENGEYVVNGISHKSKYYFLLETNKEEIPNPIYITIVNEEGEHRYEARLGESGYYELVKQPGEDKIEEVKEEVVEVELKEEEEALTVQRGILDQAEFRALALAFDQKVVAIRDKQREKERELANISDLNRQFFQTETRAVILKVLKENQVGVLVDTRAVIWSAPETDLTDQIISRIDADLGVGPDR